MSKDTIQFGLIILGQCITLLLAVWKIGQWTNSVNSAVKLLSTHIAEDTEKFKIIDNKFYHLEIEIAKSNN